MITLTLVSRCRGGQPSSSFQAAKAWLVVGRQLSVYPVVFSKFSVLRFRLARRIGRGRFGSCLESFRGWPVEDQRHRAMANSRPELSPPGPFTLELWIKPKPELDADYPDAFLLDKKYVAHDDYQLILGAPDRYGSRVLRACLGFGADSSTYYSRPAAFHPGAWYHVAFTYDGAGTGSFYLNGLPWGSARVDGRKRISPGKHFLSIGDRIVSYYHGFPGYIDQVRISNRALEFRRAKFEVLSDHRCFVRMEPDTSLQFTVTNLGAVGGGWGFGTPIINQPQSAIIGTGSITDRPVVRDGQVVIRPIMTFSLTYDHRVVDGAPAAAFLITLTQILENPGLLLL